MAVFGLAVVTLGIFYWHYAGRIDNRLKGGAFSDTVTIFGAPREIAVGDAISAASLVTELRRNGYTSSRDNPLGWFEARNGLAKRIEFYPGRGAFGGGEPAMIEFSNGVITRIVSLADNTARQRISIGPQLIGNLSSRRERRSLQRFSDLPPSLIHAVVSAEDKHFFQHTGFDGLRILKAAYIDLRSGHKEQGASTLTMQLARGFFLDSDKRWKRKIAEVLIAMRLESKLTKKQIFEDYANEVYLGRSGPFSVHGFGEGAHLFFGKDLSQVNVAEAALLAGLVQRPSYFNPFRYPQRAKERRDIVLGLMRENHYLMPEEYQAAVASPVRITPGSTGHMQNEYFVDVMNNELQAKLDDHEKQTRYIYTTLDADLQKAAEQAVAIGMEAVDHRLKGQRSRDPIPVGQPQVALIALDPHTGEVKALVGGRDYGSSQLNHALAMRQPGSSFKPFVYAAALDTAIEGGPHIFTPATILNDEPTTFAFSGRTYQPANFKHGYMGSVTLRTALAHSLNVATVSLAQRVGYDKVVAMARRAGLNDNIKATPAVALGAYEATPLEIAGAYTMFANQGMRVTPTTLALVRAADGTPIYQHRVDARSALDPRVAYLMVNMLQEVLRSGTGASVGSYGFHQPAAGKTGTSRDGWFAGFTSELLCVVWVGFDDNRDLDLEGAHSALPIWAEFMKRAAQLPQYKDARQFTRPSGVVSVSICSDSGGIATAWCPRTHSEVFIEGAEPAQQCPLHGGAVTNADRVFDPADPDAAGAVMPVSTPTTPPAATPVTPTVSTPAAAPPPVPATPSTPVPAIPPPAPSGPTGTTKKQGGQ